MAGDGGALRRQLIVAVVVAFIGILFGGTSPWWWELVSGGGAEQRPPREAPAPLDARDPQSRPSGPSAPSPAAAGCVITVRNPFASIREEPAPHAQEIVTLPPGDHAVTEATTVLFAGRPQRWFRVTAGGRSGWIRDSTILIETKSDACP